MLRTFWLSLALAFLATFASAFSLDDLNIDGIEAYLHQGQKRQASGTGITPPPPTSSARPPVSSNRPPVSTPNSPSEPATSEPPPRSSAPPPASSSKPTSTTPQSSNVSSPPKSSASVFTTPLVSTSFQEFTSVFTTQSNGEDITVTMTSTSEALFTTGTATMTGAPGTQGGNGGGSGLSKSNKNIIGGVVGGVGGALLLGGIALVFLRMRRRQSRVHEDDDDMTLGTGSALGDKSHAGHNPTPFQSNLEQYHNPGGRPNAAANF